MSVLALKERLQTYADVQSEQQHLYHLGRKLEDHKLLRDYPLHNRSILLFIHSTAGTSRESQGRKVFYSL
jgi:hypothetical protein